MTTVGQLGNETKEKTVEQGWDKDGIADSTTDEANVYQMKWTWQLENGMSNWNVEGDRTELLFYGVSTGSYNRVQWIDVWKEWKKTKRWMDLRGYLKDRQNLQGSQNVYTFSLMSADFFTCTLPVYVRTTVMESLMRWVLRMVFKEKI